MKWRWVGLGFLACGVVGAIFGPAPRNSDAKSDRAFSPDVVEAAVRAQLRDPQSAVFRDLSATNDRKIGTSPAGLVVCGYVNAKNSFGGFIGEKPFINFYGTKLVEIEPTPRTSKFNASWNKLCAG
jgi:hypothetical protein